MTQKVAQNYHFALIEYSVTHRFRQSKFAYGDSILSMSQLLLLPQQPLKATLAIKVVKIDSKVIISLPDLNQTNNSTIHSVFFCIAHKIVFAKKKNGDTVCFTYYNYCKSDQN